MRGARAAKGAGSMLVGLAEQQAGDPLWVPGDEAAEVARQLRCYVRGPEAKVVPERDEAIGEARILCHPVLPRVVAPAGYAIELEATQPSGSSVFLRFPMRQSCAEQVEIRAAQARKTSGW